MKDQQKEGETEGLSSVIGHKGVRAMLHSKEALIVPKILNPNYKILMFRRTNFKLDAALSNNSAIVRSKREFLLQERHYRVGTSKQGEDSALR